MDSRPLILVVCIAWALLAPVPVRAQLPGALPPDALIRIASAGDSTQHPVILLLHGRVGIRERKTSTTGTPTGLPLTATTSTPCSTTTRTTSASWNRRTVRRGRTFSSGGSVAGSPP